MALGQTMRATIPVGISLELVDGWFDVTHELPAGSTFTLARSDGVGAFQLSSGIYQGGRRPNADISDLVGLLTSFGREKGFGLPRKVTTRLGTVSIAGGSFEAEGHIRVWYATNGRSVVFASHTACTIAAAELTDCEAMIASVLFEEESLTNRQT